MWPGRSAAGNPGVKEEDLWGARGRQGCERALLSIVYSLSSVHRSCICLVQTRSQVQLLNPASNSPMPRPVLQLPRAGLQEVPSQSSFPRAVQPKSWRRDRARNAASSLLQGPPELLWQTKRGAKQCLLWGIFRIPAESWLAETRQAFLTKKGSGILLGVSCSKSLGATLAPACCLPGYRCASFTLKHPGPEGCLSSL